MYSKNSLLSFTSSSNAKKESWCLWSGIEWTFEIYSFPAKEKDKVSTGQISQFIWACSLKDDEHWKGDNQFKRICSTDFINGFRLTRYDCKISYHLSLWGMLCSITEDSWQISCLASSGCFFLLDVVNCICISFYSQIFHLGVQWGTDSCVHILEQCYRQIVSIPVHHLLF